MGAREAEPLSADAFTTPASRERFSGCEDVREFSESGSCLGQ